MWKHEKIHLSQLKLKEHHSNTLKKTKNKKAKINTFLLSKVYNIQIF